MKIVLLLFMIVGPLGHVGAFVFKGHEECVQYVNEQDQNDIAEEICNKVECNKGQRRLMKDSSKNTTTSFLIPRIVCTLFYPQRSLLGESLGMGNSTFLCKGCKAVVNFIKFELRVLNMTEEKVKEGIQNLCAILSPLKIQKKLCDDITNYIDEIIKDIIKGLTPGNICVEIKLCDSNFLKKMFKKMIKSLQKEIRVANEKIEKKHRNIFKSGEWNWLTTEMGSFLKRLQLTDILPKIEEKKPQNVDNKKVLEDDIAKVERSRRYLGGLKFQNRIYKHPYRNLKHDIIERPSQEHGDFMGLAKKMIQKMIRKILPMKPTGIACTLCTTIVKIITYEVKTVNASIEFIENEVKALCKLYPIEAARNACLKIVNDIDEIIQLIEEDVEPGDICKKIELCDSKSNVFKTIHATSQCKPMCKYFKGKYKHDVNILMRGINAVLIELNKMCQDTQRFEKCMDMAPFVNESMQEILRITKTNNIKEDGLLCRCFQNQPLFVADDKCERCKQLEKGFSNEVKSISVSTSKWLQQFVGLCKESNTLEERRACLAASTHMNSAVRRLENEIKKRSSMCPRLGYCSEEGTMLKKTKKVTNIFGKGCLFCQDCMKNIEKTITTANATDEKTLPSLKDGFSIFCESKGNGTDMVSVCKKISNGMVKIQKTVKKISNPMSLCEMFGFCL